MVNSLYEIETLRAATIFRVREFLLFSEQDLKTGGSPKADIKSKGKKSSTKIKHRILQQVWQSGDFYFLNKKIWTLSHCCQRPKQGCEQGMNVGIKVLSHPSVLVLHIKGYS